MAEACTCIAVPSQPCNPTSAHQAGTLLYMTTSIEDILLGTGHICSAHTQHLHHQQVSFTTCASVQNHQLTNTASIPVLLHLVLFAGAPPGLSPYWCRKWERVSCDQSNQVSGLRLDGLACNDTLYGVLEVLQQLPGLQVSRRLEHVRLRSLSEHCATGAGAAELCEAHVGFTRLALNINHCGRCRGCTLTVVSRTFGCASGPCVDCCRCVFIHIVPLAQYNCQVKLGCFFLCYMLPCNRRPTMPHTSAVPQPIRLQR